MDNNLIKPISGTHSVKEVVISLAVKPVIKKAKDYNVLMELGFPLHGRFTKFDLLNTIETKMDSRTMIPQVTENYVSGFKFSSFSQDGKLKDLIQCQERKAEQISFITYHTLKYASWSDFVASAMYSLKAISEISNGCNIVAAGLLYIDEFYTQNSSYEPSLIFNKEANDLPRSMFDSDLVDYNMLTNKACKYGIYTDGLSIKMFDEKERKTVRITDNMSFELNKQPLGTFLKQAQTIFTYFKDENQNLLRGILSSEALECIGLNKFD